MKRGEIWTVSGGSDYTGKPRPAIIVQDESFDLTNSVTVCPLTTSEQPAPLARPLIIPDETNGLEKPSRAMVDKISTVRRERLGSQIGNLGPTDTTDLNHTLARFLGLQASQHPGGSG